LSFSCDPSLVRFVANVSRGQPYDIYVGRNPRYGDPKWGNPYRGHGDPARRLRAIMLYETVYLPSRPDLIAGLGELRGRVLGCHCHPLPCHACVLARLANAPPPIRRRPRVNS